MADQFKEAVAHFLDARRAAALVVNDEEKAILLAEARKFLVRARNLAR